MKFLQWILNKSGKAALTGLQAGGLAAAVTVAGVTAYQVLTPTDVNPDTVFSSSDDEVVYVAGSGSGNSYSGGSGSGNYGDGGETRSAIQTRLSRDMQLMNLDAQQPPITKLDRDERNVNAFNMNGQTDGLGMGGNDVNPVDISGGSGGGNNPGTVAADSIAQIQAMIAAQQAALQNGVPGADGVGAGGAPGAGGSGSGGFSPSGFPSTRGNNLNATPLQGDGAPGSGRSGSLGGAEGGGRPPQGPMTPTTSPRDPLWVNGRDSTITRGGAFVEGNDLESIRRNSAKVATNAHRSVNEATAIFFAAANLSGGIILNGNEQLTSEGATSDDFNEAVSASLGGLGGWAQDLQTTFERYDAASDQLLEDLKSFKRKMMACSLAGPFGWLACISANNKMKDKINAFRDEWGDYVVEKHNNQGPLADRVNDTRRKLYSAGGFLSSILGPLGFWIPATIHHNNKPEKNKEEDVLANDSTRAEGGNSSGASTGGARGSSSGGSSGGGRSGGLNNQGSGGGSGRGGSRGNYTTTSEDVGV